MQSVAQHLSGFHKSAAAFHDDEAFSQERLEKINREIAEAHGAAAKATGMGESSPYSRLATSHAALAEVHATAAQRHRTRAQHHRDAVSEIGKAATTGDLNKSSVAGRGADEIVPTRVSAVGALPPGLRLIERTGHVGARAREGTNDAPVAPQLAKIVAMDD